MRRRLVLKKETLTDLTTNDLAAVVGGEDATPACPTFPCTDYCDSIDYRCLVSRMIDPCLTYPCS